MTIKIEARIGIQRSIEQVWEVLSDIPGWETWNPLYTKASGQIRIGEKLALQLVLPGQKPQSIEPVILDWAPFDHVHWRLSMFGGLIKSVRYLELEAMTETGCIFSNGEIFEGLLAPLAIPGMRRQIRGGFEAMGEALKERVESTTSAA
ncbi:MAG: SRPBCC domain-containing protein [Caulobacteraceae bacterium]